MVIAMLMIILAIGAVTIITKMTMIIIIMRMIIISIENMRNIIGRISVFYFLLEII